jgi:hypothetical protein
VLVRGSPRFDLAMSGSNNRVSNDIAASELRATIAISHVETLFRAVDLLPDRLRGRDEAAGDDLRKRDRRGASRGGLGEIRREVVGQRPVVCAEARQECCNEDRSANTTRPATDSAVRQTLLREPGVAPRARGAAALA